jgi:hypothetical protein
VPLANPEALGAGGALRFDAPLELDLGGLGVRSLSWWRGSYLIAAGPSAGGSPARVYRWQGEGSEPELTLDDADLLGANPEAFFTAEDNDQILLLSDDGTRKIKGKACKRLKGRKHKRFRGLWLTLPPARS